MDSFAGFQFLLNQIPNIVNGIERNDDDDDNKNIVSPYNRKTTENCVCSFFFYIVYWQ